MCRIAVGRNSLADHRELGVQGAEQGSLCYNIRIYCFSCRAKASHEPKVRVVREKKACGSSCTKTRPDKVPGTGQLKRIRKGCLTRSTIKNHSPSRRSPCCTRTGPLKIVCWKDCATRKNLSALIEGVYLFSLVSDFCALFSEAGPSADLNTMPSSTTHQISKWLESHGLL